MGHQNDPQGALQKGVAFPPGNRPPQEAYPKGRKARRARPCRAQEGQRNVGVGLLQAGEPDLPPLLLQLLLLLRHLLLPCSEGRAGGEGVGRVGSLQERIPQGQAPRCCQRQGVLLPHHQLLLLRCHPLLLLLLVVVAGKQARWAGSCQGSLLGAALS